MKKQIAILGSTGSIGTQALEVIEEHSDLYEVYCLTANNRVRELAEQARRFNPAAVVIANEAHYEELKSLLADCPDINVYAGRQAIDDIVTAGPIDMVLTAMVGFAGLSPTISAIKAHKKICLANKETLVVAGELICRLAAENHSPILPVDSEHSAIFQSIVGEGDNDIEKILLTASGGPFRGKTREELKDVTVEDALKHPNWSMGRKITVDSATLVNKGLEVMEAKWLFDVELSQIQVVVQPQSVIHSMVEYEDGAIIAELGTADMRLPIQYALYYPDRRPLSGERLDFYKLGQITFERPDTDTFRGLALAYRAMEQGGNVPTAFNAANERAVAKFLNHEIRFLEIPEIIGACMEHCNYVKNPSVEEILDTERAAYEYIEGRW